ncbi:hypothetical protein AB0K60_05500 [Thermopolyspora sp. NPDC052614]|uniref:hypothetical protein n=1 Tax=Thermopolyspora sp. NPDC052614 TaxID=3155682 RepID=UPI003448F1A5
MRTAELDSTGRVGDAHSRIAHLRRKIINAFAVNASLLAALTAWIFIYFARSTPYPNVSADGEVGWMALAAALGILGVLLAAIAVIPVRRSLGSWIEFTVLVIVNGTALAAAGHGR